MTDCHLPSGISRYFNLTDYNDQDVNIGDETRNSKIQCGHGQNNKVEIMRIMFTVGSVDRSIGRYSGR